MRVWVVLHVYGDDYVVEGVFASYEGASDLTKSKNWWLEPGYKSGANFEYAIIEEWEVQP